MSAGISDERAITPASPAFELPPRRACHNCRRQRRRCDRSLPACLKCTAHDEECLGYGAFFRWTNAVASRGKMAGLSSFGDRPTSELARFSAPPPRTRRPEVRFSLVDPLLQDLDPSSRVYMRHFAGEVCKDLVSYDQYDRNPCRLMIPLTTRFAFLRDVIISTAAIHLVARCRFLNRPLGNELVDALSARSRAIRLLQDALDQVNDTNRPAILVAIVFFITFDLLDSGRGRWKPHFEAAGSLIHALSSSHGSGEQCGHPSSVDPTVTRLGEMVMADGLAFHILSSSVNAFDKSTTQLYEGIDISAVLRKMQAFSYHSCPSELLRVIAETNQLPNFIGNANPYLDPTASACLDMAADLLAQALAVDARAWVDGIQDLSPSDDRGSRVRLALAYRAATCLYIVLSAPPAAAGFANYPALSPDVLADEVFEHLSGISSDCEIFKGAVWPTFIAGGQTDDADKRRWCLGWMRTLSAQSPWFCSWGYIQTAAGTLQQIWATRDGLSLEQKAQRNWLWELKSSSSSFLIV